MSKNFPNLGKESDIREAQKVPNKVTPKRHIIIIKMSMLNKREAEKKGC